MSVKNNRMKISFDAKSINESFARMAVVSFMTQLNPTLEQIDDVKTAVSEAVTNSIVHAYMQDDKTVDIECAYDNNMLTIMVIDHGVGIENVKEAMQPFYTTKPDMERTGMGFTFMETFMDELSVYSEKNHGTRVVMRKYIDNETESIEKTECIEKTDSIEKTESIEKTDNIEKAESTEKTDSKEKTDSIKNQTAQKESITKND